MPSHSLLLIDPFKNLVTAYRMLLEDEGHLVETALDLEEARALFHQRRYSVIMMEYLAPYEATEKFICMAKDRFPEIYILMVANVLMDGEAFERLLLKGVDEIIQKPYPPDQLLALIRKGLKERERSLLFQEFKKFYPFHPVTHQIHEYILNQTFFQKTLQWESKRAKRHGHPLSLLHIEIPEGEEEQKRDAERFLQALLSLIKNHTRAEDVLGREDGEIFLLLPETDLSGCEALTKRLLRLIEEAPVFQIERSFRNLKKTLQFQPVNLQVK